MQLYFIRHAQSTNNALWAQTGSDAGRMDDPELTQIGKQQVAHLANFLSQPVSNNSDGDPDIKNLAGFGLTHIYSSLMVRAVATGIVIADSLGLPLCAWKDLHECGGMYLTDPDTGELIGKPGKGRRYFQENYPNFRLHEGITDEGWWGRPFEAREERHPRAQRFLQRLLDQHGGTDDRVAVISHGGFYNYVMTTVFEIGDKSKYWFAINNTAITRIDFDDGVRTLAYMNRTDHLPPELIT